MEKLIGRTRPDGAEEVKSIVRLTEAQATGYTLLGTATAVSVIHGVSLGTAHTDRFWDRVYGFRIVEDEMAYMLTKTMTELGKNDAYMTVMFYER